MSVLEKSILAVIATEAVQVGGGAPIFFVRNRQEMEQVASQLEAILDAIAHEIADGLMIMVKH